MSDELEKVTRRIRKSVENGELTVDDLKKAVAKKKRQVKRSKKSGKPSKRKPSAYLNYSNHHRAAVQRSFSHLEGAQRSREVMGELARKWNALSEAEKKRWAGPSRSRSPRSAKKSRGSKSAKSKKRSRRGKSSSDSE